MSTTARADPRPPGPTGPSFGIVGAPLPIISTNIGHADTRMTERPQYPDLLVASLARAERLSSFALRMVRAIPISQKYLDEQRRICNPDVGLSI